MDKQINAMTCPFCDPVPSDIVLANDLAYARYDLYPVSPGHLLLIPFRHVVSFFDATGDEQAALHSLIHAARRLLDERYAPDGYNIGVNIGAAAGQSVMHLHVHVIPRYVGDMEEPKGGVRGVIPGKRGY
ncbi:diadenosine tetraphosphate (Ap4A) HIT family hydrolase [Methanocalculus alkaliphilus]|uniref:HIT family protein n=1 Tax=Methanocalculus alkaliphilus TaxID=768730 RepID=UPI0020A17041|nr:HIT family protein [Methanocalculus alkaliphilus]MCP1715511.1 diadenosine tetraphosphate (Ap4A) HIT family hydrolase [Methanocalculus alkaliphilus]